MSEEDRARDFEEHDTERAESFVRSLVEFAEKIYSQGINSLWLGNSGAALATLSFIGATWKADGFPKTLLWPLGLFILGVILMAFGTLLTLLRERGVIERNQSARSLLDIFSRDFQSPLERAGLSPTDWRTIMALCSGACFVAGCLVGFVLLAVS
jgi:hypothetical protein